MAEITTPLLAATGSRHQVLAASDRGGERLAVLGDEAEAVGEPAERAERPGAAMYEAVREVSEAVVQRDRQHAHVVGERAAVIADDQRGTAVEMLQSLHRVAVIPLPEAPVAEPQREGDAGGARGRGF